MDKSTQTAYRPKGTNRLSVETSPYLQQHASNPVDWYPWGEEALQRARDEDKPILLSVGYSACHWCHVMERESFENEAIAEQMNLGFVCVKVDREERPDIDHLYMTAVQMMTGQGGWPMTVFLTPDGKPFYGGTYYPPDDRYGRPGFPRLLSAVAEAWTMRRSEVEAHAETLLDQIRATSSVDGAETPLLPDIFDQAFEAMQKSFDSRLGGFGSAPKFPHPMICDFLLRYNLRSHRDTPKEMTVFTLERMAMGGLYDQLGGGFHRYSTDPYWLVPHFEKMLYDNAQLAESYLRIWKLSKGDFFRRVVVETLDYVQREMTDPLGGFYSTQDADSEGEEGKFFVWTEQEIEDVLGSEDAALFARVYDVTPRGNWEGRNILNLTALPQHMAASLGIEPAEFVTRIDQMRERLRLERDSRVRPGRDEKVVTAWNGLMLAAFADAAAAMDRPDYLDTARRNAEFVLSTLQQDGRLFRTGKRVDTTFRVQSIPGFLEDYACYADGLLRLYEATFEIGWLEAARALCDRMIALFADDNGMFFDTPSDGETLIDRPRDASDNATPAGNSVALEVLLRLSVLTGDEAYSRRAASILRKLAPVAAKHPLAFGRLLSAADFFLGPVRQLAIIGDMANPKTRALVEVARQGFHPNLVVMCAPGPVAEYPILRERDLVGGEPTAYLCEDFYCRQPTTDPEQLKRFLAI